MIDVLKLFAEMYPDYMRGNKPLEPYYSLFCGGFSSCEDLILKKKSELSSVQFLVDKMKCCGNCEHREDCVYEYAWAVCHEWEMKE